MWIKICGMTSSAGVKAALDAGAYAVVVGTAITDPRDITRTFATARGGKG